MFDCNFWLEKELQVKYLNVRMKIKLDKKKTTPNKNKLELVFVA